MERIAHGRPLRAGFAVVHISCRLVWFAERRHPMMMAINAVTRGVDVDDVAHAVNYDVPKEAGDFAHRVEQAGGPQFMARRQPFAAPGERLLLRRWSARHLYPEICT
nr:helicase-related protein [Terracidiphilus gabretensis]